MKDADKIVRTCHLESQTFTSFPMARSSLEKNVTYTKYIIQFIVISFLTKILFQVKSLKPENGKGKKQCPE